MALRCKDAVILLFLLASFTDVSLSFDPLDDFVMSESVQRAAEFERWTIKHKKTYATAEEYNWRLRVYTANHYYVKRLNEGHGPATEFELNQFADLTFAEFKRIYLSSSSQHCRATTGNFQMPVKKNNVEDPVAIDWRKRNVITPVRDQGSCGSCWAFSATSCLSAHLALKTGQLISLSKQQLLDCSRSFNNRGCKGGLPSQAFEYIRYNGGIESERDYPYKDREEKCHFKPSLVAATVTGVVNFTQGAEDDIAVALANIGPVSIGIHSTKSFATYKKGIYQGKLCSKNPRKINHAVLIVGYDQTASGEKYWIGKNSWGTNWGMNGYFWIRRGHNACGLATCASYPVV
ncbi:PREDICTED: cathepsin L1-like [Amphimedon queenslandica]|uniref:Peptidase C1A papain C-terminal domain-containing protein n=2 Tax=Amphimedon queenslandica TaxID=400682 RepID=A0AAN0IGS7_AMPQE|nr:PREDICTED: cathepsin L1-like [Amphimedon queenslandica]|eukprot:XP_003388867.1 PREDICTED: cathepsin L1-like [Amphimedon queenslandica]